MSTCQLVRQKSLPVTPGIRQLIPTCNALPVPVHRRQAAPAEAAMGSSPVRGSAFVRAELLGGSVTGRRSSQVLPPSAARGQLSSPRRFVPHARPPAPDVRACAPSQQGGPSGVPLTPTAQRCSAEQSRWGWAEGCLRTGKGWVGCSGG